MAQHCRAGPSSELGVRSNYQRSDISTEALRTNRSHTGDAGDRSLIPGSGRSPEERNGNPLQHSSLEDSTDRGAWWTTVQRVSKSWTPLSD